MSDTSTRTVIVALPEGTPADWLRIAQILSSKALLASVPAIVFLVRGGDGLSPAADQTLPAGFTLPAETSPAVATAINWALAQLGTPYSYGGDCTAAHSGDPARECDCSSLTQMAYRAAGVTLPRTTAEQVDTGTAVASFDEIQPGDLVFIPGSDGTPAAPRHVAMAIGGGLLIHSPQTGRNVQLARLAQWAPIVTKIRRPVA